MARTRHFPGKHRRSPATALWIALAVSAGMLYNFRQEGIINRRQLFMTNLANQLPHLLGIFIPATGPQLLLGQGFRIVSLLLVALIYYILF
jgi:hypothetical protein